MCVLKTAGMGCLDHALLEQIENLCGCLYLFSYVSGKVLSIVLAYQYKKLPKCDYFADCFYWCQLYYCLSSYKFSIISHYYSKLKNQKKILGLEAISILIYTLHHCPDRGPNTARGAPRPVVLVNWGSVRGGDKCGKLERCRGLNNFFFDEFLNHWLVFS